MAAALDSWHDIIRNGDASALDTLIADDAVLPFTGGSYATGGQGPRGEILNCGSQRTAGREFLNI